MSDDTLTLKDSNERHADKIAGYKPLTTKQIERMNDLTSLGKDIESCLLTISENELAGYDARWLAIARTHLQQGLMAAKRAIAQPDMF